MKRKKLKVSSYLLIIGLLLNSCKVSDLSNIKPFVEVFSNASKKYFEKKNMELVKEGSKKFSLTLESLKVIDVVGNGDNIPNKGESIKFAPVLKSKYIKEEKNEVKNDTTNTTVEESKTSISTVLLEENVTNSFNIEVSTSSNLLDLTNTNISSSNPNSYANGKLDKNITYGTAIPLYFKISDKYGNEWRVSASLIINKVDNVFSISNLNVNDIYGNGDRIANKGETLELTPVFSNYGSSNSNSLAISLAIYKTYFEPETIAFTTTQIKSYGNYRVKNPFTIKIPKSTLENTLITIKVKIKDNYDNEWEFDKDLLVEKIDNKFVMYAIRTNDLEGNGDIFPNRGEKVKLMPYLKNLGNSPSNKLHLDIKAKNYLAPDSLNTINIDKIGANSISKPSKDSFIIDIDKKTFVSTQIPLIFRIYDDFDNEWTLADKIVVLPLASTLSVSKFEVYDLANNKLILPDKGQKIKLKVFFTNVGLSKTNEMKVKVSSSSEFIKISSDTSNMVPIDKGKMLTTEQAFELEIANTIKSNQNIPLIFYLYDNNGNEFNLTENLSIL